MRKNISGKQMLRTIWRPIVAVIAALIVSSLILTFFGYNITQSFGAIWEASFKSVRTFGNLMNNTCPLLFCGLSVAISYRGGVFNIGSEGQFLAGTIASCWVGIVGKSLPGALLIILMVMMILCYICVLNGKRVLILSDADFNPEYIAEMAGDQDYDVIVANPLFFDIPDGRETILKRLRSKAICVYHLPYEGDDLYGIREMALRETRLYAPEGKVFFMAMSQMQMAICKGMYSSLQGSAQITIATESNVENLTKVYKSLKGKYKASGIKLSYTALLVKAVAMALENHEAVRTQYVDEKHA